jgi:hypothetical protein
LPLKREGRFISTDVTDFPAFADEVIYVLSHRGTETGRWDKANVKVVVILVGKELHEYVWHIDDRTPALLHDDSGRLIGAVPTGQIAGVTVRPCCCAERVPVRIQEQRIASGCPKLPERTCFALLEFLI